jgi:hypothetical protein
MSRLRDRGLRDRGDTRRAGALQANQPGETTTAPAARVLRPATARDGSGDQHPWRRLVHSRSVDTDREVNATLIVVPGICSPSQPATRSISPGKRAARDQAKRVPEAVPRPGTRAARNAAAFTGTLALLTAAALTAQHPGHLARAAIGAAALASFYLVLCLTGPGEMGLGDLLTELRRRSPQTADVMERGCFPGLRVERCLDIPQL